MIWHAVNGKDLMILVLNNCYDVFVKIIFPGWLNKVSTMFYCKYQLNV